MVSAVDETRSEVTTAPAQTCRLQISYNAAPTIPKVPGSGRKEGKYGSVHTRRCVRFKFVFRLNLFNFEGCLSTFLSFIFLVHLAYYISS